MTRSARQSNMELLRIIAAFFVVILHFNLYGSGLERSAGINKETLAILECIAIPAVNIFMMIAGYFGCKKTEGIPISRLIRLEIKVIIVYIVMYVITACIEGGYSLWGMLMAAIPNNYYVTLYIAVMLLSPYVNLVMHKLDNIRLRKFVLVVVLLFSAYITLLEELQVLRGKSYGGLNTVGLYGSGSGYTFVNFMMCYIVGAWLRLDDHIQNRLSKTRISAIWLVSTLALIIWHHIQPGIEWQYSNIFVIIQAASMVSLFGKTVIKSKLINTLAPSAFTCFLINIPVILRIDTIRMLEKPVYVLLIYLVGIFAVIFLVSWIFDEVYGFIEGRIIYLVGRNPGTSDEVKKT